MKFRFDEIAFNSTLKKKPVEEDKIHYIGLEHIEPGNFSITEWGSDVAPVGEKLIMKKGDILFGKRRAYQRKVAIAPFDGIFSAHGMVLRPKTDVIDADFFPLFISSDTFMETAMRISVGGLSPTINWKDLKEQEFELPSLEEQQTIAKKAWAAYRLKEAYQRLLSATDEMVKSQFIEWFGDMKYLTSDKTMSDFFDMKAGQSITAENIIATYDLELFPCYGGNGLRGYVTHYTHEGHYCLIGRQGALCGNVNLTDGKFFATEHAIVVTPKININTYWLFFALSEMNLNRFARGVAQPGLSVKQLETIPFSIPPTEEQDSFERLYRQADKSKYYKLN